MAYIRQIKYQDYLCEIAYANDIQIQIENIKQGILENSFILIAGQSGQGKTWYANTVAEEYRKAGYTIIVLTEKPNTELDWAYNQFPAESKDQLVWIKKQKQKPSSLQELQDATIIYSPLSLDLLKVKHKTYPVKFYSHPLSLIDKELVACLLEQKIDSRSVDITYRQIQKLKKGEWIWHLSELIDKELEQKEDEYTFDPESLGGKTGEAIDKASSKIINTKLATLRKQPIFTPDQHPTNLNFKKVMNDNKHRHVFTYKQTKDAYFKKVNIIANLKAIDKTLDEETIKHPLLIVFEESPYWLPRSTNIESPIIDQILVKLVNNIQKTYRSAGKGVSMIFTTQNIIRLNTEVMLNCTDQRLFRLSQKDLSYLARPETKMITNQQRKINNQLKKGCFIFWSDTQADINTDTYFRANVPTYATHTTGTSYQELYAKYYPDRQVTWTEETLQLKQWLDEQESQAKERRILKAKQEKLKRQQKEQEAETQTGKEEKKPKNTQPAYIEAINRIYYLHESQKKTLRQIQQDETIMSLWKIIHGRDKPSIFAIREILIKPKPQETTQKEENL